MSSLRNLSLNLVLQRSRLFQAAMIVALWKVGQAIVGMLHLPVPGGILGLALAFLLLASRRVAPASLRRGADWFIGDMLLFFVPAALVVVDHPELFGAIGLKIMAVIAAGTISVMAATALTVDFCYRWKLRHAPVRAPLR
jgi:holin-like protein